MSSPPRMEDAANVSDKIQIRSLIAVVSQFDREAKVSLQVTVKCYKWDDYPSSQYDYYRDIEGTPNEVMIYILRHYKLSDTCKVESFEVDGVDAMCKIPSHAYVYDE